MRSQRCRRNDRRAGAPEHRFNKQKPIVARPEEAISCSKNRDGHTGFTRATALFRARDAFTVLYVLI
jgi:hypothetical protein